MSVWIVERRLKNGGSGWLVCPKTVLSDFHGNAEIAKEVADSMTKYGPWEYRAVEYVRKEEK